MQSLRAGLILTLFFGLTLPLMPLQWALCAMDGRSARHFPQWYHRQLCRLLGIRVYVEGATPNGRSALFVANHVSWLDIPVLSTVAPVSFVAKQEVGRWPFVSWLARLQRTVFVDRERRAAVASVRDEIASRIGSGDSLVLFAEGTSGDGNAVLPFQTSLFAAAKPSAGTPQPKDESALFVQTIAIAYARLHGLPLGRLGRPNIAWYGDMDLASHVWRLLKRGPLDVHVRLGEPVALREFRDRKELARFTESRVRADMAELLNPRS